MNYPPLPSKSATYVQTTSSLSKSTSPKSDTMSSPTPTLATFSQIICCRTKISAYEEYYRISHKGFPPGWYFLPEDQNKSQKIYEYILVDTGSVITSQTSCKFDLEHKGLLPFQNAQSRILLLPIGVITLGNQDNFCIILFHNHIIILIIKNSLVQNIFLPER
jgi:hypothetical protein